jgi:hypothetical protein
VEVLAFAVFIGLILTAQTRAQIALAFPDQLCGYCPLGIHWDHQHLVWVHDNGQVHAPTPGVTRIDHVALPTYVPLF